MAVRLDPENNESRTLFELADFAGKQVLEIGCGDGRLTWLYADRAAHVTAIEPFAASFSKAVDGLPREFEGRVAFQNIAFEDFAAASDAGAFDIAILSWSLC